MKYFFLMICMLFSCCALFGNDIVLDEKVKLQYQIRSLFYKCEMEIRLYQDDLQSMWYTMGKMDAYDEVLQLLEED